MTTRSMTMPTPRMGIKNRKGDFWIYASGGFPDEGGGGGEAGLFISGLETEGVTGGRGGNGATTLFDGGRGGTGAFGEEMVGLEMTVEPDIGEVDAAGGAGVWGRDGGCEGVGIFGGAGGRGVGPVTDCPGVAEEMIGS